MFLSFPSFYLPNPKFAVSSVPPFHHAIYIHENIRNSFLSCKRKKRKVSRERRESYQEKEIYQEKGMDFMAFSVFVVIMYLCGLLFLTISIIIVIKEWRKKCSQGTPVPTDMEAQLSPLPRLLYLPRSRYICPGPSLSLSRVRNQKIREVMSATHHQKMSAAHHQKISAANHQDRHKMSAAHRHKMSAAHRHKMSTAHSHKVF
ncbi:hypothetical protein RYX36_023051 [Vicia faba]